MAKMLKWDGWLQCMNNYKHVSTKIENLMQIHLCTTWFFDAWNEWMMHDKWNTSVSKGFIIYLS